MLKDYFEERVKLKQQNRFLRFFIFLLIMAVVINSFVTFYSLKYERVILVPVSLSREVTFSESTPDPAYIEEIVKFIMYLALNYSPATVEDQFSDLLKYFTPDRYPEYKKAFLTLSENVKTAGVSSFFQITGIKVNPKTRKILVSGILEQWTQDKKFIENSQRFYLIDYTFDHGKFMIREFKECKEQCQV